MFLRRLAKKLLIRVLCFVDCSGIQTVWKAHLKEAEEVRAMVRNSEQQPTWKMCGLSSGVGVTGRPVRQCRGVCGPVEKLVNSSDSGEFLCGMKPTGSIIAMFNGDSNLPSYFSFVVVREKSERRPLSRLALLENRVTPKPICSCAWIRAVQSAALRCQSRSFIHMVSRSIGRGNGPCSARSLPTQCFATFLLCSPEYCESVQFSFVFFAVCFSLTSSQETDH